MDGRLSFEARRGAFTAAVEAARGLEDVLVHAMPGELGPLMGLVDQVSQAGEACRVRVAAEARARGDAGPTASSVGRWAREFAPSLRAGGSASLAQLVLAFQKPANEPVRAAVYEQGLPTRSAAAVLTEAEKLRPHLVDDPDADRCVLEGLIEVAAAGGPAAPAQLRAHMLARYGREEEIQADEDRAKDHVALSQPRSTAFGTFEYRLVLDPEGREVLEAAIGPLSAPRPADGTPDLRCSDKRRGDALVEALRRLASAPQGVPTSAKTTLVVTMTLEQVMNMPGAGTTLGGTGAGTVLGPTTMRRLACEAGVIPVVLGGDGEILDLGREKRLFSTAQVKALWLRDRHCTYPGCTTPAAWSDAHHLWHWADGGPTSLTFAALLCELHHTRVHRRSLHGWVGRDGVEWDLTPGSYDTWLARRQAAAADAKGSAPPDRERPPEGSARDP